jgi:hypothetical protein
VGGAAGSALMSGATGSATKLETFPTTCVTGTAAATLTGVLHGLPAQS